jgi:hypothetical protein
MRLQNEEQLLDPAIRAKIIEEINSPENRRRKDESFKRYLCYKDQTFLYVLKKLSLQFSTETLTEMQYALSNIAFVRKIIDKLARVYSYGIDRVVENEQLQETINELEKALEVDSLFKKTNRFLKLTKNCVQYIIPTTSLDPKFEDKKEITPKVLLPHFYDAVEHYENREKPMAFILSDYKPYDGPEYSVNPARAGRPFVESVPRYQGDQIDQMIADTPQDGKNQGGNFVFWSNKYHFTCNSKGEIISQDIVNPIQRLPFVNYAEDQDNSFWAIGGNDLTDGAVLVNSIITHIVHIAITQGYGQIVMKGKNLPKSLQVGPNKAILLEYEKDNDPTPEFSFESASPPIEQVQKLIEMYVALMLTTNNLSTSGVSASLAGSAAFPSGIAMLIDKAESMEDVKDQQRIFLDKEPEFWEIVASWHRVLKQSGELVPALAQFELPAELALQLKFGEPKSIETESERLGNLKLKKELGLITNLDMIKLEYPDYTDEQAEAKLQEILADKLERAQTFTGGIINESKEDVRNPESDDEPSRPGDSEGDEPGDEDEDQE